MSLHERAKLRLNQQRRLDNATDKIIELIKLHMPGDFGDREVAEVCMIKSRLTQLIKHQHVIDREVATARIIDEGY
jgi:hypothetical protein